MNNIDSVRELIDALGGNAAVSRALALKPSTVGEMKRRGSIPVSYWPGLIELARRVGLGRVNSDLLVQLHTARAA